MRFQAYFTPIIKIILFIMSAITLAGTVVGILVLAGVHMELTTGQGTLLVSICPVLTVIALLFATLHYKVDSTHLRLYIGFIDVLGGRINISKILNIVMKDGKMYISYLYQGADPVIAAIVINPKRYGDMKEALMAKNPNIAFFEDKDESSYSK